MTNDTDTATPRNPAEDLALIRQMMEAGRNRVAVSGIHFILWGVLLTLAFLLQYLSIHRYLPEMMVEIWAPMMVIGWIVEFWIARRRPPVTRTSNPAVVAHSSCWTTVGVITLLYFALSVATETFRPEIITILSAGLMGGAYWVTSAVTGVRWLRFIALGWWAVLAYATTLKVYGSEVLLVMAASSALLLTLPGFVMRHLYDCEE